jgi:hypothetical protein
MGQINFVRDLISENLSLEGEFELNWEDWNFTWPNLIFSNSIGWNQGSNYKILEVWRLLNRQIDES